MVRPFDADEVPLRGSTMEALEQGHHSSDDRPTHYADRIGAQVVAGKTAAQRKAGGLYLTPIEVADFMAKLPWDELRAPPRTSR